MIPNLHEEMKKAVVRSQHTQRNWDLSKEMPQDDIDMLVHAVTTCPSKQNFAFYNVHVITNRETIEQVHELTTGLGVTDPKTGVRTDITNSQTLANLLIVFEEADVSEAYKYKLKSRDSDSEFTYNKDKDMAVGIAAGYVNVIASMLGYQTGCCACGQFDKIQEVLGLKNAPILLMGVGYKDPNRERREHHTLGVKVTRRVKEPISVSYIK
jgi:nitroreductase